MNFIVFLIFISSFLLDENNIKFLNGAAFQTLDKLTTVELNSNVCIDEDFTNPTQIANLQQSVDQKCSFEKSPTAEEKMKSLETAQEQSLTTILRLEAELKLSLEKNQELKLQKTRDNQQIVLLQESNTKLEKQLQELKVLTDIAKTENILKVIQLENDLKVQEVILKNSRAEVDECKAEKVELKMEKAELKLDLKAERIQCNKQLDYIKDLHEDLKLQWNATCNAELKELRNNLQFKLVKQQIEAERKN